MTLHPASPSSYPARPCLSSLLLLAALCVSTACANAGHDGKSAEAPLDSGLDANSGDSGAEPSPPCTPAADSELPYDGLDNDCDPTTPDDDLDGDGYPLAEDCDDADPAAGRQGTYVGQVYPYLIPTFCDGYCRRSIDGDLDIEGQDLPSLSGLECLDAVSGSVTIALNPSLLDLTGLEGLAHVEGDLVMNTNPGLLSLHGLGALTEVGGTVTLYDNDLLGSLEGLEALAVVGGDVDIYYNDTLLDLHGLDGISELNG